MGPFDFIQGAQPDWQRKVDIGRLFAQFMPQPQPQPTPVPLQTPQPLTMPQGQQQFTLGQFPQLQAPTPMPGLAQVNLKPIMDLIQQSTTDIPAPVLQDMPPDRQHPQRMDFSPMRAAIAQSGPKDHRLSARDRSNESFADAMQAAARAAAGSGDIGQLLAGAGAAFGGAYGANRDEARAEDLDFEDRMRAHNLTMAQTDFEIAQAENEAANTDSEIDHQNALQRLAVGTANREAQRAQMMELRQAKSQAASQMLDLAQVDVGQKNAAAQVGFQNKEAQRTWDNEQILRRVPQLQWTDRGVRRNWIDADGTMKTDIIPTTPDEEAAQLDATLSMLDPITASTLKSQIQYQRAEKYGPGAVKRKFISDILSDPEAEKIFDPDAYLPNANPLVGFAYGGDWLRDAVTTGVYEKAVHDAKQYVDAQIAAGTMDPTKTAENMRGTLAALLENELTPEVVARARKLKSSNVQNGFQYYNKYFGSPTPAPTKTGK